MKKFLVPVDFSETSAHTLQFVLEFNKRFFAHLDLIHLFDVPFAIADEEGQLLTGYEAYRKNYEEELWDFLKQYRGDFHYDIQVHASAGGYYQGIMKFAKDAGSELIIVGNRGQGRKKRLSLGSVAKYLVTHPQVPVLAIPEDYHQYGFSNIALATDLITPIPAQQIGFLKRFAERQTAAIHILHVKEKDAPELPETSKFIEEIKRDFGKSPEFIVRNKDEHINDAIHDYINRNKVDLLVTIPHFHSWIDLMFIGSETRQLLASESIPILSLADPENV